MNVLFLALGGTRRPAVAAEAGRIVADGGTATVLVRKAASWEKDPLPSGVKLVELSTYQRDRPWWVRLPLYRVPRLLLRVCLPGPLSGTRERVDNAYRRRVARPIDRRLARFYRRDPAEVLRRAVLAVGSPDLLVVADVQSFAPASGLLAGTARTSEGWGKDLDVAFYGRLAV
ncbi:hypothetical protein Acsp03_65350 [Actinomadura sp. NBRC 104412]|uniref:hypothetical protein n=1 Tax=Actinomadura sp. NBRC 104412 TaxID=3032203 RepID=UPI0024A04531|nr:hypothetical protein [Actinomadura sp. NBRC 104412]GLZ09069.1 hypothetical protein Acsp03_65350 [Actinomadura sp. NBRC 104412]